MTPACEEYLTREKAAMATEKGADHQAICNQVAQEFGLSPRALANEIKEQTVLGAC